jgi:cytochrome c5
MKCFRSLDQRTRAAARLAIASAGIYAASLGLANGDEAKTDKVASAAAKPQKKAGKRAERRSLTGAELYALNCNRCHNERYPTEFTAAQWKTIMLEMRTRANLPAEQANAILKYLQGDSGTP